MRQRSRKQMPDTATITRRVETGENNIGEPLYDTEPVAEDVPCRFRDESTEFVRQDSGERVNKPATVAFSHDTDVQAGDTITIDGIADGFEVRGIEQRRDKRRGRVIEQACSLERNT